MRGAPPKGVRTMGPLHLQRGLPMQGTHIIETSDGIHHSNHSNHASHHSNPRMISQVSSRYYSDIIIYYSDIIGLPKKDKKQSIKNKVFTLIFWVCGFVTLCFLSGFSLISHELLDKTYIYAHHQNGLIEEIKIMCFICRFGVYFSRNHRKCSQNGEDGNLKI